MAERRGKTTETKGDVEEWKERTDRRNCNGGQRRERGKRRSM